MERESVSQQCPYCGETVEVEVDAHGPANERYTEDCPVCCRPWDVRVRRSAEQDDDAEGGGDGGLDVELRRDDD
jgi:hypothetical protein